MGKSEKKQERAAEAADNRPTKKGDKQTQIASQEEVPITIPESVLKMPRAQKVRFPHIDLTPGNFLSTFIHSTIMRMCAEKGGIFVTQTQDGTALNPANLSYYLHWISLYYLNEIGAMSGPVNTPDFVKPDEDYMIPNELAKVLEYMSPYSDRKTGWESLPLFKFPATGWPTMTSGTSCCITDATTDFIRTPNTADRTIWIRKEDSNEGMATDDNYDSTVNLVDIVKNAEYFNALVSGCGGVVSWGKIARRAPDASFLSRRDASSGSMHCFTPDFDAEMAYLFGQIQIPSDNIGQLMMFEKAGRWPFLYTRFSANFPATYEPAITDMFCILCGGSDYVPGKFHDKMLQTCKYGGGKKIKTMYMAYFQLDGQVYASIFGAVLAAAIEKEGLSFTEAGDMWYLDLICKSQVMVRMAKYVNWGVWGDVGATKTKRYIYDPTVLDIPVPYLLANYISSIGPVNLRGTIMMPWFPSDTNYWRWGYIGTAAVSLSDDSSWNFCSFADGTAAGARTITNTATTVTFTSTWADRCITPVIHLDLLQQAWEQSVPGKALNEKSVAPTNYVLGSGSMVVLARTWRGFASQFHYTTADGKEKRNKIRDVKLGDKRTVKGPQTDSYINYIGFNLAGLCSDVLLDLPNIQKDTLFTGITSGAGGSSAWTYDIDDSPVQVRLTQTTTVAEPVAVYLNTDSFKEEMNFARGEALYKKDKAPQGIINRAILDQTSALTIVSATSTDMWKMGMPAATHSWLESAWNNMNDDTKKKIKNWGKTALSTGLRKVASMASGGISDYLMMLYDGYYGGPNSFRDNVPKIKSIEDVD